MEKLLNGSHEFSERLSKAKRPMIVIGSEALQREDGAALQSLVQELSDKLAQSCEDSTWKVYNVLHKVRFLLVC